MPVPIAGAYILQYERNGNRGIDLDRCSDRVIDEIPEKLEGGLEGSHPERMCKSLPVHWFSKAIALLPWVLENRLPNLLDELKHLNPNKILILLGYKSNCDLDDRSKP